MTKKKKKSEADQIWDDSELIEAYDRAVLSYQQYHSSDGDRAESERLLATEEYSPNNTNEQQERTENVTQTENDSYYAQTSYVPNAPTWFSKLPPPPPPPFASDSSPTFTSYDDIQLQNLLLAWYQAGFEAGVKSTTSQATDQNKEQD
mmetsp:Transcript_8589/g.15538  ORF Transcript_8589/g.15538 Transcript_8589/m.15538 type:complete len:148 (+) Transcript_8589:2270-2713(+)